MKTLIALAVAGILALAVLPTMTVRPVATEGCPFQAGIAEIDRSEAERAPSGERSVSGCPFARGRTDAGDPEGPSPAPEVSTEDAAESGCPFLAGNEDTAPIDPVRERNRV